MERILPNGMRYYPKDTNASFAKVILIVPVGENHEDELSSECAHACEHFASAFNGGFTEPYGFLSLRNKYGIRFNIKTYEDYTLFQINNIRTDAIPLVCKFVSGVFNLNIPTPDVAKREIDIVKAELESADPITKIYYAFTYWIRQQSGKPTDGVLTHNGAIGLNPEKVYHFHSKHYQPSSALLRVCRSPKDGVTWDRYLSETMSRTFVTQVGVRRTLPNVSHRAMIKGSWIIPSKEAWGVIGIFYEGPPQRSEVLSKTLIASTGRLTGNGTTSLVDYLRKEKGIAYSVHGRWIRFQEGYTPGTLAIIMFTLSRHLTREEIQKCNRIVGLCSGRLPSRGDISSMVARHATVSPPEDISFLLSRTRIPIIQKISWPMIYKAHKTRQTHKTGGIFETHTVDYDTMGSVFSCPT